MASSAARAASHHISMNSMYTRIIASRSLGKIPKTYCCCRRRLHSLRTATNSGVMKMPPQPSPSSAAAAAVGRTDSCWTQQPTTPPPQHLPLFSISGDTTTTRFCRLFSTSTTTLSSNSGKDDESGDDNNRTTTQTTSTAEIQQRATRLAQQLDLPHEAQLLLDLLLERQGRERNEAEPELCCIDLSSLETTLIDSWSRYQATKIQEIQELLHQPQKHQLDESPSSLSSAETASVDQENRLLAEVYHAAASATKVLEGMTSPSSHHYVAVLKAWANTCEVGHTLSLMSPGKKRSTAGIPQRMQHLLLNRQQQQQQQQQDTPPPTVEGYNQILKAWAYSSEYLRGTMAEQIFQEMEYPNLETLRFMMLAHAKSPESRAAFHATGHFMRLMRRLFLESLHCHQHNHDEDGDDDDDNTHVVVSLDDYHTLCHAWTKAGDKHAPSKVCTVLEIMNDAYRNGSTQIRPDLQCYRDALITVSKRQQVAEVGELADGLLRDMQDQHLLYPDTECYRAALVAWKHAAMARDTLHPEQAIQRTYELLKEMREAYHRTTQVTVQATTQDFNHVLQALSLSSKGSSKAWKQGQALFQALQDDAATTGGPDVESYKHLFAILRKSGPNDKLGLAANFIQNLGKSLGMPSSSNEAIVDAFNAFLRVCASIGSPKSRGKDETFDEEQHQQQLEKAMAMVLRCVEKMTTEYGLTPNAGTYAALIEAGDQLLPFDGPERAQALENIFSRACYEGCVDQLVLERFKQAASTYLFAKLVVAQSLEMDDLKVLPESWTRNVQGFKEGKRGMPLGIHGAYHFTKEAAEYRMRNLRRRKNQALLRGGRMN